MIKSLHTMRVVLGVMLLFALSAFAQGEQTEQTEQAETMQETEETMAEAPAQTLEVETQMCMGIEDRQPVGPTDTFSVNIEKVYLWMKVTGAEDSTAITLVWSLNGEEKARHDLPVNSPSWRTWATKSLMPDWTGNWEVKILNPQGDILKAVDFTVVDQPAMEEMKPAEEKPVEQKPADTTMPSGDSM